MHTPSPIAPTSLENPAVIDRFGTDERTGEILLVMREDRRWTGSELQLHQLHEKFNAYVSFLLDGEMLAAHPELAGKKARIELRSATMPDEQAITLLGLIHDQLALQEIGLEVIVAEAPGCGDACTCHA